MSAHGTCLTGNPVVRIVASMGTTLKITGAVDRHAPDPAAPTNPMVAWIGMVRAEWSGDLVAHSAMAAILRVETGGAPAIQHWGASTLALRWVGDPPSPEIARAVYDLILDRGPAMGSLDAVVEAQQPGPSAPSYQRTTFSPPAGTLTP